MARMQIQARNDFAADARAAVHAIASPTPTFRRVPVPLVESGDLSHRVSATPDHSAVERTMRTPSVVQRFLGDTLTLLQDIRWNAPAADGSRTGTLDLTVKGMPAKADVTASRCGRRPARAARIVEWSRYG